MPAQSMTWNLRIVFIVALLSACAEKPPIVSQSTTDVFVQDFNPPFLDVLWVIDDRSPMQRAATHLTAEASLFFQRLDSSTSQYRMAFISSDMQFAQGALKTAVPITIAVGVLASRTAVLAATFQNIINAKTGGLTQGLGAAEAALKNNFKPQASIPMVLVFISDSYDRSDVPTGTVDRVGYFADRFKSLVGGNRNLIRVYSIGYTQGGQRCATVYDSDIDRDVNNAGNTYLLLSENFKGSTGDLCSSFSTQIDLSGIRLKELPNRFKLSGTPSARGIEVVVTKAGRRIEAPSWTYDSSTNEVVFVVAPSEGSTIQVIR